MSGGPALPRSLLRLPTPAISIAMRIGTTLFVVAAALSCAGGGAVPGLPPQGTEVTVREGTSMAVAISPDGRTLAIDLQGSIWTLPITGGSARRLTDGFDDARQPSWSPDGQSIAFQGYRDGSYDIWAIDVDGRNQRKLTSGAYDEREPAWSHDGARVAFSSDRDPDGNYDIWTVDTRSGDLRQVTRDAANDYMPTWAPGDSALAFISTRGGDQSVWAISTTTGDERRISPEDARADAPSWGPANRIVYHVTGPGQTSALHVDGAPITGDENAFPFRAAWRSANEIVYVSDGRIRRRSLAGSASTTIDFEATLGVVPARYARRVRDTDSQAPRQSLGIVSPRIAPDGQSVAFVALGDLWVMRIGASPENLTRDRFLDAEPAWSPDGTRLAWATDRGGGLLDLWVRDLTTGEDRQLTRLRTSAMSPAWSPDGSRIAFLDVDAIWRRASVSVVDVATGTVTRIHPSSFGPGAPTWSADGRTVAIAALEPYSSRFREGTNRVLLLRADGTGGEPAWTTPGPHFSLDSRVGAGPAWAPNGSAMAVINDGVLAVLPVSPTGEITGTARRLTTEMAHAPSWTADSRRILYQSMDRLRLLDVDRGTAVDVPLDLPYTPAIPSTRLVVHAGTLVDGTSDIVRRDMDIVIDRNRIREVVAHSEATHAGRDVVDASTRTVMPGLIEFHTHLQKDFGEAHGRAWLAYGITTVRSPGSTPYEAVEDREAVDAGTRLGPRVFATGYLMEWQRTYYKMAVAIASERHLEMELERARVLEHDLIKSYVRMPDLMQRRIVEFAHRIGVPAASHEIYPASSVGIDGVEHTTGTSRRGYSPKATTLMRSYADVSTIIGGADLSFTPTLALSGTWLRRMVDGDPSMANDPRVALLPPWMQIAFGPASPATGGRGGGRGGGAPREGAGAQGEMIMAIARAGGRVVAGTDTPNPASLHAELAAYVAAGMTPFEALRTATVTPAAALRLDAGSVVPGKLADLVIVDGNPLDDIANARRVHQVIANGRLIEMRELLTGIR